MISESTVRVIKRKYSEALLHAASVNEEEDCTVATLPKGKVGRPLILGEDMDREARLHQSPEEQWSSCDKIDCHWYW